VVNNDDKPYVIESATRIRLGPLAKEMAAANGMNLNEMARHLLQQDKLRQAGMIQRDGES
jgi:hypothetical protein